MKKLNNKGFTLIEMVIVIVIIAILAAMLVPSLLSYVDNANKKSFLEAANTIKTSCLSVSSEEYAAGRSKTISGAAAQSAVAEKLGSGSTVTLAIAATAPSGVIPNGTKSAYKVTTNSYGSDMSFFTVQNGSYWATYQNGSWGDVQPD